MPSLTGNTTSRSVSLSRTPSRSTSRVLPRWRALFTRTRLTRRGVHPGTHAAAASSRSDRVAHLIPERARSTPLTPHHPLDSTPPSPFARSVPDRVQPHRRLFTAAVSCTRDAPPGYPSPGMRCRRHTTVRKSNTSRASPRRLISPSHPFVDPLTPSTRSRTARTTTGLPRGVWSPQRVHTRAVRRVLSARPDGCAPGLPVIQSRPRTPARNSHDSQTSRGARA